MSESLLLCFSIALFFTSMTLLFLALFLSYQKHKLSIEETKLENEQLKIQSAEDTEKYKAILSCNTLDNTNSIFENIKHIDEYNNEFWYARELQKILEYKD